MKSQKSHRDRYGLLDVDVETGLRRRLSGGGEWNRLDAYAVAFHQRVRQGYQALAQRDPQRWVTVDANRPFELMTYPGGKHGLVRHADQGPHALHTIVEFFRRTLAAH